MFRMTGFISIRVASSRTARLPASVATTFSVKEHFGDYDYLTKSNNKENH